MKSSLRVLAPYARRNVKPTGSFSEVEGAMNDLNVVKPPSSQWYTGRPGLTTVVQSLSGSLQQSRVFLYQQGLLPSIDIPLAKLPDQLQQAFPHPQVARWKNTEEMSEFVFNGNNLRSKHYRQITTLLSQLEALIPFAEYADKFDANAPKLELEPVQTIINLREDRVRQPIVGPPTLAGQIQLLLNGFQSSSALKAASEAGGVRLTTRNRHLGGRTTRHLFVGRGARKTSSAQVLITPIQKGSQTPGSILVNKLRLANYFPPLELRQKVISPLSITDTVGGFNVFAIARGGGKCAQADAIAMGLARAIVEWETYERKEGRIVAEEGVWRDQLRRAGLILRDPRMVERKKTGQPKARKKNAWVKR